MRSTTRSFTAPIPWTEISAARPLAMSSAPPLHGCSKSRQRSYSKLILMATIPADATIGVAVVSSAARPSKLEEEVVALFEQHRNSLLRYLLSFRIAAPDAEEIVQEIFLSLFQHLLREKSRTNLHGWVFKVAHNL